MNTDVREKREILITEGKILKLHKVLKKELTEKETRELPRTLQVAQGFISAKGWAVRGPLITLTRPVSADGVPQNKTAVLFQLQETPAGKPDDAYEYTEELRIENCLYTRFTGERRYLQTPYSKISVYAYENFLKLSGEFYTVYIPAEGGFACDIFAEVVP